MRILAILLGISIYGLASAQQTKPDFSKAKALINDYILNRKFPSISVAVVKKGEIIWEESFGYANLEKKQKATPNTPYLLASVSKTMTATALMKLAEQKLIRLDGSVNNYFKGAKVRSHRWDADKATVKMVMSHTSGLTTFNFWCRTDSLTCARMDDEVMNRYAVLVDSPGAHFDYSNLGYGILDRVISGVSGTTFTDYMQREIFGPMGMKNTFVAGNPLPPDVAIRYAGSDPYAVEFPYSHSYSAGGSTIYSSAHDLALFAMLHLNDQKRKALISKQSVKAMQDTVAKNGSSHYGLAWWIDNNYNGYKGLLAQGGNWCAQAWMQLIPSEDIAAIAIGNYGDGSPYRQFINEVLSELLPVFKTNMIASANAPKTEIPPTIGPEPVHSNWKGILKTYRGDIPLQFNFSGVKSSTAALGAVKSIALSNVNIHPNWYSYTIEGDLGLDDLGDAPYKINFYLTEEGDDLYGSAQTRSSVHPGTPSLSFWVEMKRE